MNKVELVKAVSDKTKMSQVAAAAAIDAVFDAISDALAKGESVAISGFGAFKVNAREAREARNPKTGAMVKVPACKSAAFKAGKVLKEKINK